MKAAVNDHYGPPNTVRIRQMPTPFYGPSDVLIQVHDTTVTSGDWRLQGPNVPVGLGLISRLLFGIFKPRNPVFGTDIAGVITAVGADVTRFEPGDQVIGFPGLELGGHAQYVVMPQNGRLVRKPDNLDFEHAAAIPFAGTTALDFLRRKGDLQSGEKILIIGASGAVGSAAVQLAKDFGAHVTGVCSTANIDFVKSQGADQVIDYTQTDFTQAGDKYDVILDTTATLSLRTVGQVINDGGRILLVNAGLGTMLKSPFINMVRPYRIICGSARENTDDLAFLVQLAEKGGYAPYVDKTYPLENISDAFALVATGHKRGNVVISMPDAV